MIAKFTISTNEHNELVDITDKVQEIVKKSKIKNGICQVFVPHATAAITINENADPNVPEDILNALRKIVKEHNGWKHDSVDNNAAAHIKSSIIGASEMIPIDNNELVLGTWQDVFLCEFDGPRTRTIIVNIIGDKS